MLSRTGVLETSGFSAMAEIEGGRRSDGGEGAGGDIIDWEHRGGDCMES